MIIIRSALIIMIIRIGQRAMIHQNQQFLVFHFYQIVYSMALNHDE